MAVNSAADLIVNGRCQLVSVLHGRVEDCETCHRLCVEKR